MSLFERILFEANSKFQIGKYKESVKILSTLNNAKLDPDQKALFYWCFGRNQRYLGNFDRSIKYLENALNEKVKEELFVHPFSLIEIAELHLSQQKKTEALSFVQRAKNYHDEYDFKPLLLLKIKRTELSINLS